MTPDNVIVIDGDRQVAGLPTEEVTTYIRETCDAPCAQPISLGDDDDNAVMEAAIAAEIYHYPQRPERFFN